MAADLRRLPSTTFDLAVIGGGLHGLFAALDAAAGGWQVVLFERDDFGAALSSNHQRTVHGGLRALQSGRLDRTRAQLSARREWAHMAPHLVRPLPFLLPTGRGPTRSRALIGAGLRVYNWLGRHRNEGLPDHLHLPAARIVPAEEAHAHAPGMVPATATGGALWFDYQLRHPDRLNWLVALAAERAGAAIRNHMDVAAAVRDRGRIVGLQVRDRQTGETSHVATRRVLVAAGGSVGEIHERLGLSGSPLLLRACNLLVDRPAGTTAVAARGASGRMLTATPWAGYWLIGTFQGHQPAEPSARHEPPATDVDSMIDDANGAFPHLGLRPSDVRLVHFGLTPAIVRGGRAELMPESTIELHDAQACTLVGVKFTTARETARRALAQLGLSVASAATAAQSPLPFATGDGADQALEAAARDAGVEIDDDVRADLVDWYGTEAADVVTFAAGANLARRLASGTTVMAGEVLYATERGRALRLADVVLRRTRLGGAGHPGREVLERAADLMGAAVGWSAADRKSQIAEVEARYQTPEA